MTLSLTPVLADQLEAPGVDERLPRFLRHGARAEPTRLDVEGCAAGDPAVADEVARAAGDYPRAAQLARGGRRPGGLLAPRRTLAWTSSATHAVLPLLATDAGVRLQVETGIDAHRAPLRRLGRRLLAARVRARPMARPAARARPACTRRAST